MSEAMTLRDTIVPKSDQLNYDDFMAGPFVVNVTGLAMGSAEQPVIIKVEGHHDYKPNKSMRRVLINVWGDKGKDWIGKSMMLYGESSVKWGGKAVGGIQISHMSGITSPVTTRLTVSRGKRIDYVVKPLEVAG